MLRLSLDRRVISTLSLVLFVTDCAALVNISLKSLKNAIVIPHLGASTEESDDNCAIMAVEDIRDYLENGNIHNSVNYPNCDMGVCAKAGRVAIFHKNVTNMIAKFTSTFGDKGINISDLTNKSKGEVAYTMLDVETAVTEEIVKTLENIEGVFRVRVVK